MGRRRMTYASGNKPPGNQEENSNGRRNEAPERSRLLLCVVCISVAFMAVHWTTAEEPEKCKARCWKKALSQDMTFTDGLFRSAVDNEKACKDVCANNETCDGVYWGFNDAKKKMTCWLQIPLQGSTNKLSNANHWIFTNCTDDCLTYCWKPKWDNVQTKGGIYHPMADSEEQCKKMCANDALCDGVDWSDAEESCYLLYRHRRTKDKVTHWEIVRDIPTHCTKEERQCMPHCWTKTVSPELSFNDGMFKKKIDNERNCKDVCASNQTCIGIYWGFNTVLNIIGCFHQMPTHIVSESLKDVNHWQLSNCTEDCLPYCWLPKWDFIHSLGGVYQYGIDEENWCKVTCTYAKKCNGIDYNHTDDTCWLLYDTHLLQTPAIGAVHHWEIDRNLPAVCSNESSVLVEPKTAENKASTEAPAEAAAEGEETTDGYGNETDSNNTESDEGSGGGGGEDEGGADTGESAAARKARRKRCPNYLIGIIALTSLMGVCVLIIIALVAFIIARTLREREGG